MKRFATLVVALGLGAGGSAALAEEGKKQASKQNAKPQPVIMSDAQLDTVAGGSHVTQHGLVNVEVDLRNSNFEIVKNVQVNAAVLGRAVAIQQL